MVNNILLEDELKRIAFVMNYDSKKLVSENIEDTKNLVVENKIENLFTPKTSTDIVSETTLRKIFKEVWDSKQKSLISEQWVKGVDQVGYWKTLFDQLKAYGVDVRWQVANNPTKSTYMSWGPWVIYKDGNKNGGWPITFTDTAKKMWLFKFPGGRYLGTPMASTNLESKYVNATFNFGKWSKMDQVKGTPSLQNLAKTKPKTTTTVSAAGCVTTDRPAKPISAKQIPAVAAKIFKDLAYAFDGVGTYEDEAVNAYKRITCKAILDAVNAKVAARGMKGIKNVGDWAKSEMSDYDYGQYREIWSGLQKLGYKAPPVSQSMRAAGIVGDVTGVNAIEKVGEGLQQLFSRPIDGFEKLVNAIRSFLGGVAGGVITTMLDFTGVGKVITTIGWGLLLVGDLIVWLVKGAAKIPEMILSIISMVTTGAIAAPVAKFLKPFFGTGASMGTLISKVGNSKFLKNALGLVQKGMGKISSMVSSAIKWIMSTSWWKYLAKTKIGSVISSVAGRITQFIDDFSKSLASGAGSKATTTKGKEYLQKKGTEKIKGKLTTDFGTDLGWEGAQVAGEELGGEKGAKAVKLAKSTYNLGGDVKSSAKTPNKIAMQQAGTGYRGPLTSIGKENIKNIASTGKDLVKTADTGAKLAGYNVNNAFSTNQPGQKKQTQNGLGLTGAAQKVLAQTKR